MAKKSAVARMKEVLEQFQAFKGVYKRLEGTTNVTEDYNAYYLTDSQRKDMVEQLQALGLETSFEDKEDGFGVYTIITIAHSGGRWYNADIYVRPAENRGQIYIFSEGWDEVTNTAKLRLYKFGEIIKPEWAKC